MIMATESYMERSLGYKLRKVMRYIELYGPARTLVKVRSQYHMNAKEGFATTRWDNQACASPNNPQHCIGLLGCGSFAFSTIAYYLNKSHPGALRGVMDISSARARSLATRYQAAYATTTMDTIIEDPAIRLVYIASNHASHAEYAIAALDAGKHVHIEKPHVVSADQLQRLTAAMQRNPAQHVFLGFNRPRSDLFKRLMQELAQEAGPAMINWFVAGHAIDSDHWYFSEEEGGRILGNLCHWTDLTMTMVGLDAAFPCRVIPSAIPNAKSDFVTSYEFANGSLAVISFSAKGHTFDGVRETLNVHRGDLLAELKDFKTLSLVRGAKRSTVRALTRDHGHKANILNSYAGAVQGDATKAPSALSIVATAALFLATREAHVTNQPVTVGRPGLS
jgi:predicted dehydrogenase